MPCDVDLVSYVSSGAGVPPGFCECSGAFAGGMGVGTFCTCDPVVDKSEDESTCIVAVSYSDH